MAFPLLAALLPLLAKAAPAVAGAAGAGGAAAGGAAGGAAAGGGAAEALPAVASAAPVLEGAAGAGGEAAGGSALQSMMPTTGQGWLSKGMKLNKPETPQGQERAPAKAWEQPPMPYTPPQVQGLSMQPYQQEPDAPAGWGFLRNYLGR